MLMSSVCFCLLITWTWVFDILIFRPKLLAAFWALLTSVWSSFADSAISTMSSANLMLFINHPEMLAPKLHSLLNILLSNSMLSSKDGNYCKLAGRELLCCIAGKWWAIYWRQQYCIIVEKSSAMLFYSDFKLNYERLKCCKLYIIPVFCCCYKCKQTNVSHTQISHSNV